MLGTIHVTVPDVWPCTKDEILTPLLSLIQNGCPEQLRVKVTVLPALNLSVGFKVGPEELKRYPNERLLVTLIEYELCPIKGGVVVKITPVVVSEDGANTLKEPTIAG